MNIHYIHFVCWCLCHYHRHYHCFKWINTKNKGVSVYFILGLNYKNLMNHYPQLSSHVKYICYLFFICVIGIFLLVSFGCLLMVVIEIGSLARLRYFCMFNLVFYVLKYFKALIPELILFFFKYEVAFVYWIGSSNFP